MAGLGWQELVIVLVIIMIIFGAGKLPDVVKSLGQGVKEFKTEANAPTDSLAAATAAGSADAFEATVPSADRPKVRADEI
ncbi:MAG: twin-arginine translocase TatA/TatE family subunit [Thermomicrobiales bacterium]|nr:twin-arginine translocase TatA/TatE family subunit [Thermomicrobiales bacterium]